MNEQARRWQHKLDVEFPRGLLAAWEDGGEHGAPAYVYLCPRVEVVGMSGLDPEVFLPVPDFDKVVQPGTIAKFQQIQSSPCKVVQVTFGNGRKMAWSDGLTQRQVEETEEHRDQAMSHHAEHGQSAWTPPPGE